MRTAKTILAATLLLLIAALAVQAPGAAPDPTATMMTVVQKAAATGTCNTFVAAIKAAGLVSVLSSDEPFTIFAPSDEAFAKLPAKALHAVLRDREKLTALVERHIIFGRLPAGDLAGRASVEALDGSKLELSLSDGILFVDVAKVTAPDLCCRNGVVHVVDAVIGGVE
jgi:transforming growth factor-beta-induced protein